MRTDCICRHCGATFSLYPSTIRQGGGVFCSHACKAQAQSIPLETRFWQRVEKTDGCWRWTGPLHAFGYGLIWRGGNNVGAHRISWEIHVGPIPDGLFVLHRCDNPPCVRPDHLFLGTQADNIHDMVAKGRNYRHVP